MALGWKYGGKNPQLYVSVASSIHAVAALLHLPPAGRTKATLVTHTWDEASRTEQANATFTQEQTGTNPFPQLQALSFGNDLLSWDTGMWPRA